MTIKRLLSILTVIVFMLGSISSAFAADAVTAVKAELAVPVGAKINPSDEMNVKISKDEAKKIATDILKNIFDMEIDEKKFQSRIELRQDYEMPRKYVWEFRWDMHNSEKSMNVHVSIDGNTGKLVRINRHEYIHNQEQSMIAKITEEQAKKIAEKFINKINPDEFKEVQFMDNHYMKYDYGRYRSPNYYFRYIRKVNGISFDRNSITVEVDGRTGTVTSYNFRWDYDLQFSSLDKLIPKEKAEEIFNAKTNMKLRYVPIRDQEKYSNKINSVRLVYAPDFSFGYMLDAEKGEMIDYTSKTTEDRKVKDLTQNEKEQLLKNLKPIHKSNKEIDNARAEVVIKSILKELFNNKYEIERIEYEDRNIPWDSEAVKTWSARFVPKDGLSRYEHGGSITINAMTEELISLYRYYDPEMDAEEFEPKLTWEQAYDKAIQMIAKYFPDKLTELETEQTYRPQIHIINGKKMPERRFSFNFTRMVNSIQYPNNSISIGFDIKTGEMTELRCNWNEEIDFPNISDTITEEEAKRIFFETHKAELTYTMINKNLDDSKPAVEVKAVYKLNSPTIPYPMATIDAFTGKLINYDGQEIVEQKDEFKEKIKGHWAEKQLTILATQNIIDAKNFDPDKEITTLEFIKMMVNAKGYHPYMTREAEDLNFTNITKDDENYGYLQIAVRYGLIENKAEEFNGDSNLTRENMAEILIKFLNYDTLAKSRDIFTLPFEDADKVSPDKIGYVAIGKGLDIFVGSNGKFRPKDNTTMVEAAVTIYNALSNIKNINR
jgi:hypothetical protein